METGLAIINSINAVAFFQPGASTDVLDKLEVEVRAEAAKLDISTDAGRKAIASLSHKVAKSKTGLDAAGKELVSGEKARLKLIDNERAAVWDRLEALQAEVRKPLTDWEDADKKRIAGLEFKVIRIGELGTIPFDATVAILQDRIAELDSIDLSNMMEFTSRVELAEKNSRAALTIALKAIQEREEQAAEMSRLRAESAAREQKERDERIAQEAREKAQREAESERRRMEEEKFAAEAKAKQAEAARIAAQEQAERDAKAAEERTEQLREEAAQRLLEEHQRATREAEEAENRHQEVIAAAAKKAEDDRIAAEAKAKKDADDALEREKSIRQLAAEKAEKDRVAAVEAERARVAAEAKRVADETKAREKDKEHKATINNAAVSGLVALDLVGITGSIAKEIIKAIAQGKIPNVKISY